MEVLYPRCAGLDVHKDTVVACVRCVSRADATSEVRTFGTTTTRPARAGGLARRRTAARTSRWRPRACTGSRSGTCSKGASSWCSPTPQHIRNVPGRKTDVNDAMWIADLLAHGLIRSSFVPPAPIQELRDLTRTRKQLVREIAQHTLRIQKMLEDANIKVAQRPLERARAGAAARCSTPSSPARRPRAPGRARRRVRPARSTPSSSRRCAGGSPPHHRAMLKLHLGVIDALEAALARARRRRGKSAGADPGARPTS